MTLCMLISVQAGCLAASSEWKLYFWSETYGLDGDAGQFVTTDDANVFVLKSIEVPGQGLNFGVHNTDWSVQYGWSDAGGSVSATGVAVQLAASSQASGWLALAAGSYDVTFDASALTIQFDEHADDPEPEPDPEPEEATFLMGGDLSMATYVEDWGAKFYYKDGTEGDLFDIMEAYGINLARLRLYHAPGTGVQNGSTTYRTPIMSPRDNWNGYAYAGEEDILNLALRAKAHNMQICLTIYLSDYWSGATEQYIPAAWANVNTLELLGDSVYNYVYRIMTRMVDQGTTPEFVSVGNETNYGLLYQDLQKNYVSYGGHTTRNGIANTVYLFNKAYDAIKEVAPAAQVIIHHSYGDQGKIGLCRSFFQQLKNNGCKFDIVGGSYYPHWATDHGATDCKPSGMLEWAADMETNIGKPVMLMEVGYSWHPYKCEGRNGGSWAGQLGLNGCYDEASKDGQEAFIKELHQALDEDKNILGYMYWDPIFVDQYVNGAWIKTCWAEKYSGSGTTWWEDGNVISNTTLFDFTGKPLSALYREIYSRKPVVLPTEESKVESQESKVESRKIIRDGMLLIERDGKTFNVFGTKVVNN